MRERGDSIEYEWTSIRSRNAAYGECSMSRSFAIAIMARHEAYGDLHKRERGSPADGGSSRSDAHSAAAGA